MRITATPVIIKSKLPNAKDVAINLSQQPAFLPVLFYTLSCSECSLTADAIKTVKNVKTVDRFQLSGEFIRSLEATDLEALTC